MNSEILIKNGRVIDPANGIDKECDVLIVDDKIADVGKVEKPAKKVIDAAGKLVVPGLVDVHVHFRQPGQEYKEDIYSGSRAAAAGGFTTVIAEPNTNPPIDTAISLKDILEKAKTQSVVNFFSKACISKGMQGEELVSVKELRDAGAKAISDDGHPVSKTQLMRNALSKAKRCRVLVNPHCEDSKLHLLRKKAEEMKPNGQQEMPITLPFNAEADFVNRDIRLAEETEANIHISHVSLATSVTIIARAKKRGVKVTAEATPHHFALTEEMIDKIDTNAKVNPPIRSKKDVEAIQNGLANGTIDIIASDHAPHTPEEKSLPWDNPDGDEAPFGIIGLETTLGLVLTYLVEQDILTINQAIEKMTILPAMIFGLTKDGIGSLSLGKNADVTIIDTMKKWKVDANRFYSKGRNCPFNGWELQGKAIMTIVGGRIVMENGQIREVSNN